MSLFMFETVEYSENRSTFVIDKIFFIWKKFYARKRRKLLWWNVIVWHGWRTKNEKQKLPNTLPEKVSIFSNVSEMKNVTIGAYALDARPISGV